jgi:hypothetical protein
MSADTARLREALARADERPWRYDLERLRSHQRPIGDLRYAHNRGNVDLIVAAVNALPALLDELDALRAVARAARIYRTANTEPDARMTSATRWTRPRWTTHPVT